MRAFLIVLAIGVAIFIAYTERQRQQVIRHLNNEDPARFEAQIQWIESRYKEDTPTGHIVFLGDSLIRLWTTLKTDMAPLPVLNHGFGGAKVGDATFYADRLVTPFDPQALIVSIGTNDIHGITDTSKSGEAVADLIVTLFETIQTTHPDLPILYISVTPTPSRWKVWEDADTVNQIIKAHANTDPNLHFLDLRSEFLSRNYLNRDLYDPDGLHLNAAGYAVWVKHVKPALIEILDVTP